MDDADEELRMIMQLPELAELMKTDAAVMGEEGQAPGNPHREGGGPGGDS